MEKLKGELCCCASLLSWPRREGASLPERGKNKEEKGGEKLKIKIMLLRIAFELAATRRRFPSRGIQKQRQDYFSLGARCGEGAR